MCLIFYFLMTQNLSLLRKFQNKVMPQKFQYTKVHKKRMINVLVLIFHCFFCTLLAKYTFRKGT